MQSPAGTWIDSAHPNLKAHIFVSPYRGCQLRVMLLRYLVMMIMTAMMLRVTMMRVARMIMMLMIWLRLTMIT